MVCKTVSERSPERRPYNSFKSSWIRILRGDEKAGDGSSGGIPGGMQIGGGITADNAQEYLDSGASHVIVTSYVFQDGIFHEERLQKLVNAVGKEHVVLRS